nr:TatD family hydrolase [Lachnospiraceae bacterium]
EDSEVFYDAIEIMKEHPIEFGAVVHCFCSNLEIANAFLDANVGIKYFGIGGAIGDRANEGFIDMVKNMSLEKLLVETDAPYQHFETGDKRLVNSMTLFKVIDKIAELKGITPEEVMRVTYKNACEFYGFEE